MNQTYIPALDGTRALAVLLVMLFHFHQYPFGSFGLDCGWVGVQLFFVLSGFLITRILLHEKQKPLGSYLKRFYWRRTLRIFPVYFAYLFAMAALFLLIGEPDTFDRYALSLFTYTYNYSRLFADWQHSPMMTHLWSLCVEEQFYLLWPFIVYFSSEKRLKRIIVGLWLLCPAIRWLLAMYLRNHLPDEAAGEAVYWFTFSHFDAFGTGAAVYLFQWPQHPKAAKRFWVLLGVLLAAGLANYYFSEVPMHPTAIGFPTGGLSNGQHIWSYTLLNFTFAALLALLMRLPQKNIFFTQPVMLRVGQVSYGVYLYHWAVLGVIAKLLPPEPVDLWLSIPLFAVYFTLVYGVAWLSFRFFESPLLRFKGQ